jgi:N-acetylneuraminic acid mutarotase
MIYLQTEYIQRLVLEWSHTGSMNYTRESHTASILTNEKVLVTGGYNRGHILNSVELYDPSTETWITTGSMNYARHYHTTIGDAISLIFSQCRMDEVQSKEKL